MLLLPAHILALLFTHAHGGPFGRMRKEVGR